MSEWILVGALGVVAGALTTVAGMGGGVLLLLVLSLVWDPATALACTTPALLAGNVHRAILCREAVHWPIAARFSSGALPGGIAGALLAAAVPATAVAWLMAMTTALGILRAVCSPRLKLPPVVMTPGGFAVGALTGTAGGAGVLAAPLFLSAGLTGEAYVGTSAACAAVLHAARLFGYGASGLYAGDSLGRAMALGVAILVGNQLGRAAHAFTRRWPAGLVEHAVLATSAVLALVGLAR